MPYKRTKRGKKKAYKKRRNYKKKVPRPLGAPCRIVRSAYFGVITPNTSIATFGAYSFALSDLPDYSEFTNLFDEYMIAKVTISFRPQFQNMVSTAGQKDPYFMYVVDKDDSAAATNINTLLQYPAVRITSSTRSHFITFKPRFAAPIFNGVTDAYGSRTGYLDCSNAAVPHYGFKWAIDSAPTTTISYIVWVKYVIMLRGVR